MGNTPSRQCELEIEEKTVFLSGEKVYRIPALFYDRDRKRLLAFAERRKTRADTSTEVLVMKTGMVIKDEDTHEVTIKVIIPSNCFISITCDDNLFNLIHAMFIVFNL